jgi:hypothetical protein
MDKINVVRGESIGREVARAFRIEAVTTSTFGTKIA